MKNPTILDRNYFSGSASRRFETSAMMPELLKNPKIAAALYDKTKQREFHDAVIDAMNGSHELDADMLRVALHDLYNRNSHVSKGSVKSLALAMLAENRDPSKEYFVKMERGMEPETIKRTAPQKTLNQYDSLDESTDDDDPSESGIRKRTIFQRIFG
jgi:hypothetical protein